MGLITRELHFCFHPFASNIVRISWSLQGSLISLIYTSLVCDQYFAGLSRHLANQG